MMFRFLSFLSTLVIRIVEFTLKYTPKLTENINELRLKNVKKQLIHFEIKLTFELMLFITNIFTGKNF